MIALLDTGSQINAISTEWHNKHKKQMGKLDVLKVTNMIVKGAVGRKSKPITQQVMLEIRIGEYITDSVFIIVPNLIRDCIIGISLLPVSYTHLAANGILYLMTRKENPFLNCESRCV